MFFESLGPLLPFLIAAFKLNYSQAGQLGFIYSLSYGLFNYPSGHWCDKYGRRIFILLFLLISSLATFLMAFSFSFTCLFILCALAGIGGGLYHPPGTALVSDNFPKNKRGMALGFHASGGALGILLSFLVGGVLASRYNWKIAVIVLATIGFALAIYFRIFAWGVGEKKNINEKILLCQNKNSERINLINLLKWLPYMLYLYGIVMFVWKGAYIWIPTYIKETYFFTPQKAINFSIILPIIGIFSNYLVGKLSDYYGRRTTLSTVFASLALCFFLLYLRNSYILIPLLLALGFSLNAFSGIINAYIADLLPSHLLGKAFGITFTFSICISALAPYLMGAISDKSSLATSMLFLSVISLIGMVSSLKKLKKFSLSYE